MALSQLVVETAYSFGWTTENSHVDGLEASPEVYRARVQALTTSSIRQGEGVNYLVCRRFRSDTGRRKLAICSCVHYMTQVSATLVTTAIAHHPGVVPCTHHRQYATEPCTMFPKENCLGL